MAKIIPYGDPAAHGKFGASVVFRRHRGTAIMQMKGKPRNPRTAKQVAVRNKLTQSVQAYSRLTDQSRAFYFTRGGQKLQNGRDFFLAVAMKDKTPSKNPQIQMQTVSNMAIFNTVSGHQNGFEIAVEGWVPSSVTWDCLLWCELEDLLSIQTPIIGPTGQVIPTVSYVPGRFNNAVSLPDNNGAVIWQGLPTNTLDDHGMMSCWWKPGFDSNNNSNQGVFGISDPGMTVQVYLIWYGASKKFRLEVIGDSGGAIYEFPATFSAGQWYYINVGWDANETTGNRLLLNFNDSELVPSVISTGPWTMTTAIQNAWIGDFAANGYCDIDNLKLYGTVQYRTQEIANKNNEGFKPQPGDVYTTYGKVVDTSNVFTHENDIPDLTIQRIRITELAGRGAELPFRYAVNIIYGLTSDPTVEALFRLPKFILPAYGNQYFYLVDDWSAYWDLDYWKLACTDNV